MLRSIGDNIVISSVKNTEYEKNGIIIKRENTINLIGNVVSVGGKVKYVNVGDKILYNENNSRKILYENAEYFVIKENEVLAIIWGELWRKKLYMQMMQN